MVLLLYLQKIAICLHRYNDSGRFEQLPKPLFGYRIGISSLKHVAAAIRKNVDFLRSLLQVDCSGRTFLHTTAFVVSSHINHAGILARAAR
jgi:hypothetical protein